MHYEEALAQLALTYEELEADSPGTGISPFYFFSSRSQAWTQTCSGTISETLSRGIF